jgi:acyl-CoA-binding protein
MTRSQRNMTGRALAKKDPMTAGSRDLTLKFHAAFRAAKQDRNPRDHTSLLLYSYYKQATQEDVKDERPSRFLDFVGGARYDAWAKLKGMSKDDAMENYINEVALLNLA